MIKYAIKKPHPEHPNVMVWNHERQGRYYVDLIYYETEEEAQAACAEFGEGAVVAEAYIPDPVDSV
jgi:hypothetical protein